MGIVDVLRIGKAQGLAVRARRAEFRREELLRCVWVLAAPYGDGVWCGPYPAETAMKWLDVLAGIAIRPVATEEDQILKVLELASDDVIVEELDVECLGMMTIPRVWRGITRDVPWSCAVFEHCPDIEPPRLRNLLRGWLSGGGGLCGR